MPELPEVETMRRGLLGAEGGRFEAVVREPCPRKPITLEPRIDVLQRRLRGARLQQVDRIGKRIVLRSDHGQNLVIEPRMTGLVLVADPPTVEHLRLRIELSGCRDRRVWFWDRRGLGTVRLLSDAELAERLGPEKLGPDALHVDAALLRERLGASQRAIKVALLDQSAVAGIGNLYASEILHVASVDPRQTCRRLVPSQWSAIADATLEVLKEAILHEGSTLSDGTYRNALNQTGDYQNMHRVYDRAEQPCPRCHTPIIRIVQAQRSTFYCPKCQTQRPRRDNSGKGGDNARSAQ
ncbi:MAG: bifunctional DNA-formamidopyrimidine glycosylase/DNA-(apurinic or apyrimidinic site) lyase [Planctomycetales bacterium]|nr:bifunctional DNA-formamidopyrimidine glycosylase/DNA-(apurinic or apyrimidinic site) lyase [Planctomycetales bacterium]